jgi:hypothetical protein
MSNSKSSRVTERLNPILDARLIAYMAAGMGVVTMAQSADAKIVYTPANIAIGRNTHVSVDLNNDGLPDFTFSNFQTQNAPLGFKTFLLSVKPDWKANRVVYFHSSKGRGRTCAADLPARQQVGPQAAFQPGYSQVLLEESTGSAYSTVRYCPWAGTQTRKGYVGVKFNIGGQTHYGWIRLTVAGFSSATITGYAYETVPNKSISTGATSGPAKVSALAPADVPRLTPPEPASLGLLACGAEGIAIWRRDEI